MKLSQYGFRFEITQNINNKSYQLFQWPKPITAESMKNNYIQISLIHHDQNIITILPIIEPNNQNHKIKTKIIEINEIQIISLKPKQNVIQIIENLNYKPKF